MKNTVILNSDGWFLYSASNAKGFWETQWVRTEDRAARLSKAKADEVISRLAGRQMGPLTSKEVR